MNEQAETPISELEVLFPDRRLTVGGKDITLRPLTLKDLPKVTQAFGRLVALAQQEEGGLTPAEIAVTAIDELTELIPYCTGLPADEIPLADLPAVLEVIVEQNLTAAAVGKWIALVQKLPAGVVDQVVQAVDQGDSSGT